jgi:hypothetical protein
MIATTKTIKRDPSTPAVADPRRSYDRGIWVGSIAEYVAHGTSMPDQPFDLASLSVDSLRRELDRRQKGLEALIAKRAKVAAELAALEAQIRELQGDEKPARRAPSPSAPAKLILPRPKNSLSLTDALALAVEAGAIVSPTEAAKLVRANGFVTTSKSFVAAVSNALSRDGRFRRVGRGQYERVA